MMQLLKKSFSKQNSTDFFQAFNFGIRAITVGFLVCGFIYVRNILVVLVAPVINY